MRKPSIDRVETSDLDKSMTLRTRSIDELEPRVERGDLTCTPNLGDEKLKLVFADRACALEVDQIEDELQEVGSLDSAHSACEAHVVVECQEVVVKLLDELKECLAEERLRDAQYLLEEVTLGEDVVVRGVGEDLPEQRKRVLGQTELVSPLVDGLRALLHGEKGRAGGDAGSHDVSAQVTSP